MLPLTIRAVFLNLLSFAYLAESFVLLTANVEDIKQIAKKFLSESITDQISEFISKAKLHDVSDENERHERDYKNSRENENFDAGESNRFDKPDEPYSYQPRDNEGSIQFNPIWQEKREKPQHDNRYDDRPPLKIDSTYFRPNNDDFEEHGGLRIQVKPKRIPRMGLASLHPSLRNRKNQMTTERYRHNEFDQYDNTNYERSELVATSGHLGLSRVKGFNNRKSKN